jgi:hypothetical protein
MLLHSAVNQDCRHCPFGPREPGESLCAQRFVGDVAHGRVLVDHCSLLPCSDAQGGTVAADEQRATCAATPLVT